MVVRVGVEFCYCVVFELFGEWYLDCCEFVVVGVVVVEC